LRKKSQLLLCGGKAGVFVIESGVENRLQARLHAKTRQGPDGEESPFGEHLERQLIE
jgi:hypothetical protein